MTGNIEWVGWRLLGIEFGRSCEESEDVSGNVGTQGRGSLGFRGWLKPSASILGSFALRLWFWAYIRMREL